MERSRKTQKRATLHDVAHHAGVSKSTVSLVLQNSTHVSETTREKILSSIEKTGYVYNRRAAGLRQDQQNNLMGILVNELHIPYNGEVIRYLEQELLQRNLVPLFASTGEDRPRQEKLVQSYLEHKVSGILLCPAPETNNTWIDKIWRNGTPCIQIMRETPFNRFPAVVAANHHGMYQATQHLIQLGHQRIAFVGGNEHMSDYHERLAGFMDAMNEADLNVAPGHIYPVLQSRAAGREALQNVLAYDPTVTAIVCFSDLMAYGVLSMSREMGIRVGKELSVIGFDDLADSHLTYPALTSVRVDTQTYAKQAITLLDQYIRDQHAPVKREVIPAQLMIRESCGQPHYEKTGGIK